MTKFITEPNVYLVSTPFITDHMNEFYADEGIDILQETLGYMGDKIPEVAGRLCYMSFKNPRPGGNAAYLQHIKESGHGSVLEHTNFSLILTGISRSLTHELVRHRAGFAYSQLSQRYVDESDCNFVIPYAIQKDQVLVDKFKAMCLHAIQEYAYLQSYLLAQLGEPPYTTEQKKSVRSTARCVLPNATETKIFVTANARAWRHFIEMRANRFAEVEIRRLAVAILDKLQDITETLFSDYERVSLGDGTFEVTTPYRKV